MEQGRITECFLRLHQCIDDAVYTCEIVANVPAGVRDGLSELEREAKLVRMTIEQGLQYEYDQVMEYLDDLQKAGDRALFACRDTGSVDRHLQNCLQQAHDVIWELKQKLLH